MRVLSIVPALLVFLAPDARAGDGCAACEGSGAVACRAHRAPTAFAFKHSLWLQYECCLGTGWKPCPTCKDEGKTAAFEKIRAELGAWVEERRTNCDQCLFAGEPSLRGLVASKALRHAESEHFRLASTARTGPVALCDVPEGLFGDLPKKSAQKRAFSPEHGDWIMLKRFEDAFADFKRLLNGQGSFASAATNYHGDVFKAAEGKYDVFLWDRVEPHLVCGRTFFGSADELGVYKHATRLTTVVGGQDNTRNDEMLHRYLTHILHHLFIEAYQLNIGYDMPPWVPEGFAHYMEFKKFGDFKITCAFERSSPVAIPGRPQEFVRKLVASRKALPAADIVNLKYNTMDPGAHCQIFSLFQFLIEDQPREKFIVFLQRLKHTRDTLKAFSEAYGFSFLLVDEPWQKYVAANYR